MKKVEDSTLKRLSDNFISLVILQFINYLLPLLLIPYLIHVLGIGGFGIYSFILAIMMYGIRISDYGFELSATYHISRHRDNPKKVNEIFSSVLIIKFVIVLIYLLILTLLTFFIDKLFLYQEFIFLSFGMLFGQLLSPVWFFQGVEKMRYIMYLNGLSRFLFLLLVFLFVKEENDLYILFILNSVSVLFLGVVSLYFAVKDFNIRLSLQPWSRLFYYLKDGWYIFTSKFAVELYTTVNMIILGFMASPLVVGYYAVSVKIIHAVGSLLEPLTRTVYPYLVNVYTHSNRTFISKNIKLSLVIFIIMTPVSLLVGYFAETILGIVTGEKVMPLNIEILQLFSVTLIVYLYGSQFTNMLVTIKKTKFLNIILFLTAGVNTLLAPISVYFYGVKGMVWLSVSLAFFLTISKGYYLFFYQKIK